MKIWIESSHKLTDSEKYTDVVNGDVINTLLYFLWDKLDEMDLTIDDIEQIRCSFEVDDSGR